MFNATVAQVHFLPALLFFARFILLMLLKSINILLLLLLLCLLGQDLRLSSAAFRLWKQSIGNRRLRFFLFFNGQGQWLNAVVDSHIFSCLSFFGTLQRSEIPIGCGFYDVFHPPPLSLTRPVTWYDANERDPKSYVWGSASVSDSKAEEARRERKLQCKHNF